MSQHFKFLKSKIEGLCIIERSLIEDERGFFSRFFCEEEYKKISDSWTNRDLFYKNNKGDWVLKQSVGKENK